VSLAEITGGFLGLDSSFLSTAETGREDIKEIIKTTKKNFLKNFRAIFSLLKALIFPEKTQNKYWAWIY
jgi:hypothetical protein